MAAVFGPYEVLEQVAVGSTGTVYRARHTQIGRVVAVKVLHPGLLAVPGLLERFRAEARMLAGLDDPHVVTVYDFVEEPDKAWLAQEWVEGATLQAILHEHGTLAPEQAVGVMRGALQGLAHAHDRDLVHRDIAPGNIVADMAGTSMLLDFGLAAPVGDTGACGTPAFVSPEAARADAVGKPADVYSAGAVLFLLLTGAPPFPAADAATALRRHLEDRPPVLRGHGPDLAGLVRRCLAKDPGQRPPDAAALLAELEEAARRRFGAAWLGAAGLTAAVATTVAAGRGTGGGSGGRVNVADTAQTAAIDTGSPPPVDGGTRADAQMQTRRIPKATAVAAAAAVVLAVGGATAYALTSGGSSSTSKKAAPSAVASSSTSTGTSIADACGLLTQAEAIAYATAVMPTQAEAVNPGSPVRKAADGDLLGQCTYPFAYQQDGDPMTRSAEGVYVGLSVGTRRAGEPCSVGGKPVSGVGDEASFEGGTGAIAVKDTCSTIGVYGAGISPTPNAAGVNATMRTIADRVAAAIS